MMLAQDEEEPPRHRSPLHSTKGQNGLPSQSASSPSPSRNPSSSPSRGGRHASVENGYSSSSSVENGHSSSSSGKISRHRSRAKPKPPPSSSSSSRRHGCRRRSVVTYTIPLWAYVFCRFVLDVRPSSYLPESFTQSLKREWNLSGGGGSGESSAVRGGGSTAAAAEGSMSTSSGADAAAVVSVERMDSAAVGAGGIATAAAAAPPQSPNNNKPMPPHEISPELAKRVDEHPYNLLRDVTEVPVNLDTDLPYFWHIHKSGGSTMKHILYCLGRTQTRRIEEEGCSNAEPDLRVCHREFGTVINADASSIPGIERAMKLKLSERVFPEIEGTKAFVVDTSRVFEAMPIFSQYRKGRLFVLFRHPVERAVSKYHYMKIATWEKNYKPELKDMTMMEYAQSRFCYNNWMVRRLVHKMAEDLTRDDLNLAKEILRRKALVLFTDDMPGSAERVRQYFFWSDEALGLDAERKACLTTHIYTEPMNANPHPPLDTASPEWAAIREKNLFDLELVRYARELYVQQGEMLRRIIRGGTYGTNPPPPDATAKAQQ